MHNTAGFLERVLEIAISRDREASAAKELPVIALLRRQHGTIYSSQSSSTVHELGCDRPSAGRDLADRAYRPGPGDNRIDHGTVTDASGAAVPGATVTITQTSTNDVHTAITSDSGFYTVPQLPPGKYRVSIEKGGFNRFEQNDITLVINQTAQINAELRVGSSQEVVTVTSASPIIQTDTSSVGLVIDSQTIQETPLNGHTSLIGLIALAPGVQNAGTQDQVPVFGVTPAIGTGGRNSYGGVGFSLDGAQTKSGTLQRGLAETASLDAIAEFKTLTTGAPAEFNQPAQIVVVTQSGGNTIHGGAFEFNRGRGTSAKQYFAGALARPPYQRNEYGAWRGHCRNRSAALSVGIISRRIRSRRSIRRMMWHAEAVADEGGVSAAAGGG